MAELAALHVKIGNLEQEKMSLEQEAKEKLHFQILSESALQEKKWLEAQLVGQKSLLADWEGKTQSSFTQMSQKVLLEQGAQFLDQTQKRVSLILEPLKQKLSEFEKKVEDSVNTESKERFALHTELERLVGVSEKVSQETQILARTLKGDFKASGAWGELVLERLLEASGLREGIEFRVQPRHVSEEEEPLRPDLIVDLPDEKHLIIDSKVSLSAFELLKSAESEEVAQKNLAHYLDSLDRHIDQLSLKHYPKMKGTCSPEVVFLFVPIEAAFIEALRSDPDLLTRAWKKGVALVSASTLLASLKTVASLWKLEKQNRNAAQIASEGAKLYDKFVSFLEDFEKIGKSLNQATGSYDAACSKFKEGQGNLIRRVEILRDLGTPAQKRIKKEWLEESL